MKAVDCKVLDASVVSRILLEVAPVAVTTPCRKTPLSSRQLGMQQSSGASRPPHHMLDTYRRQSIFSTSCGIVPTQANGKAYRGFCLNKSQCFWKISQKAN